MELHLDLNKTASFFPPACSELRHLSQCIPPATLATYSFNPDQRTEKQEHYMTILRLWETSGVVLCYGSPSMTQKGQCNRFNMQVQRKPLFSPSLQH